MSGHWAHVVASWALVLGVFAALALGAAMRHRAAAARLRRLEAEAPRRRPEGVEA